MQITRFPSIDENGFFGCLSAFVDSLFGQLNSAAMYLDKLSGKAKGASFAYEMSMDTHRYGALIVLDRWATLVDAFGSHLRLSRGQNILEQAPARVQTAENILGRANQLIDDSPRYSAELVSACLLAFRSLHATFAEEREAAARQASLGPMLPAEFREARRVFLEDLAAR